MINTTHNIIWNICLALRECGSCHNILQTNSVTFANQMTPCTSSGIWEISNLLSSHPKTYITPEESAQKGSMEIGRQMATAALKWIPVWPSRTNKRERPLERQQHPGESKRESAPALSSCCMRTLEWYEIHIRIRPLWEAPEKCYVFSGLPTHTVYSFPSATKVQRKLSSRQQSFKGDVIKCIYFLLFFIV